HRDRLQGDGPRDGDRRLRADEGRDGARLRRAPVRRHRLLTDVQTPDGRTLAVHELGDPDGLAVFMHHGTPGSGLLYEKWATPGIRLISYDRAGYGESTRNHGRTVGSAAADVDTIADAFGLDRFASWGISGGGPHALACGALCERLTACATLAGVG